MKADKIFLFAGEASGDLHAGALAEALRRARPGLELEGVGGPAMEAAGVKLIHRYDEFAVLGISEVVSRLPFFLRVLGELKEHLRRGRPDLFIPVDFPDFNFRLAASAKKLGIPVLYYISPQVWAWRRGRIKTLARIVDRMVVVFPFEEDLYRAEGVDVVFVGHPLLDRVRPGRSREDVRRDLRVGPEEPLVALLPGSRRQEVERLLPPLADAARFLAPSGIRTVVSRAGSLPPELFERLLPGSAVPVRAGATYDLVSAADLAVVASGTATLETGLLGTPLIVVYKMSGLSWRIARRLVKMPYIGLVNIAAGKKIAPEFLQDEVTGERLAREVEAMIRDPARLAAMRKDLSDLPGRLGGSGASDRAAGAALDLMLTRGKGR